MHTYSSRVLNRAIHVLFAHCFLVFVALLAGNAAFAQVQLGAPAAMANVPITNTVFNWTDYTRQMASPWYGDTLSLGTNYPSLTQQGNVFYGFVATPGNFNQYPSGPGIIPMYYQLPKTLAPGTTYYWQIIMFSGFQGLPYTAMPFYATPVASFTTAPAPNLQLSYPAQRTGIPVGTSFGWVGVPGATGYQIYIWNSSGTVIANTTVSGSSYKPSGNLAYGTWYYWSVRAIYANPTTYGPWASYWGFMTQYSIGPIHF